MIGRLTGVLADRAVDGSCVLDVGGVGYEVFVPLSALGRLASEGPQVTLHVHTHVREDALTLYGFPSSRDRAAFRALLSVSSIGPKLALAILGALDADGLAQAVASGDRAAFKGIPGVGRKTAERLLLDLKDKLPKAVALGGAPLATRGATTPAAPSGPRATVVGVLVQMGYKPSEAERAVGALRDDEAPVEELIRAALLAM